MLKKFPYPRQMKDQINITFFVNENYHINVTFPIKIMIFHINPDWEDEKRNCVNKNLRNNVMQALNSSQAYILMKERKENTCEYS